LLASRFAQAEAVATEVDLDHSQLLAGQLRETVFAQLVLQALESGAGEHLALEPFPGRPPRARPDRQVDARDVRNRAQAFLDYRLAEEAGAAGDQDGLAPQGIGDQDGLILGRGRSEIGRAAWRER